MKVNRKVEQLLKRAGAVLKRHKKHLVFGLGNGETVVVAGTPSDRNAYKNQIRDIEAKTGLAEPKRKAQVKRDKPGRFGEQRGRPAEPINSALRDQLLSLGAVEDALRSRIAHLESQLADMQEHRRECWLCRLHDWWKGRVRKV